MAQRLKLTADLKEQHGFGDLDGDICDRVEALVGLPIAAASTRSSPDVTVAVDVEDRCVVLGPVPPFRLSLSRNHCK